jgi:predicted permease
LIFEVLPEVKLSILVFWLVTPCGLSGTVHASVSDKHQISSSRLKIGGCVFIGSVGIFLQVHTTFIMNQKTYIHLASIVRNVGTPDRRAIVITELRTPECKSDGRC